MACHSHSLSVSCVISVCSAIACSELNVSHHPALASISAAVHPAFSLAAPNSGPFPSDWFTVEDSAQLTGLRVNLPMPECGMPPSADCVDLEHINRLDGFNVEPRLSIPFDGPIDVYTVTSETLFLLKLDNPHHVQLVGINQVVWDPKTLTLHVKSDEILDQHARYGLIVTRRVLDSSGNPIEASKAFRRFRHTVPQPYKRALLAAIQAAHRIGIREDEIAVASVFTTLSVTAVMEKIRDQIMAATPELAEILFVDGMRAVFPLNEITGIVWRRHTGVSPDTFSDLTPSISAIDLIVPGAVGRIAFGKYVSPQYRVEPQLFIPAVGTRTGILQVQGVEDIYFNLYLPSGSPPPAGWPVVIMGVAGSSNKETWPLRFVSTMAERGIATISINPPGHGHGPLGTLIISRATGGPATLPSGGRGRDVTGDGVIGAFEGFSASNPDGTLSLQINNRDGVRQAVADLVQLVRVIKRGIDVDGDAVPDLDSSRIYYHGRSNAGIFGIVFMAIEPDVLAGTIGVAGGPLSELGRLSPVGRSADSRLGDRLELINPPGITHLDGVAQALPGPYFNENFPLRDGVPYEVRLEDGTKRLISSPTINTVAGAIAIQEAWERMQWIQVAGEPEAYAPHLRKNPLAGMPTKSLIVDIAKGDRNVPNPSNTAIVRAGDIADRTTYYLHDLAFAEDPRVTRSPHGYMSLIDAPNNPLANAIARGSQHQLAIFLATDGAKIIQAQPARFFETPISSRLPEGLNFIP